MNTVQDWEREVDSFRKWEAQNAEKTKKALADKPRTSEEDWWGGTRPDDLWNSLRIRPAKTKFATILDRHRQRYLDAGGEKRDIDEIINKLRR